MTEAVWFRHPAQAWSLGDVRNALGKTLELKDRASGEPFTVELAATHPCDPSHLHDSDDIAAMNNMHEGPLLYLLEARYRRNVIYTFTGSILISINPCVWRGVCVLRRTRRLISSRSLTLSPPPISQLQEHPRAVHHPRRGVAQLPRSADAARVCVRGRRVPVHVGGVQPVP